MPKINCTHITSEQTHKICVHLLNTDEEYPEYFRYFTGKGLEFIAVCYNCKEQPDTIHEQVSLICDQCFEVLDGSPVGVLGIPESKIVDSHLVFSHRLVRVSEITDEAFIDIQPCVGIGKFQNEWIALTESGWLIRLHFNDPTTITYHGKVPTGIEDETFDALHLAPDGSLIVLYNRLGKYGLVIETDTLQQCMVLQRDGYHSNVSPFPVAFFIYKERTLLIHSKAWNRLDISDPLTGEVLTERGPTSYLRGESRPEHYLDYFHSQITVSPNHQWVADDGWVWHPVGIIATWNLSEWFLNPWTSEDGNSIKRFCYRDYFWSGPVCWIDDQTLAVWGCGEDDLLLVPGIRTFNVVSGEELGWFIGPEVDKPRKVLRSNAELVNRDALVFDKYLFSISEKYGVQVWDVQAGARLLEDRSFYPVRYHRGIKEFLTRLPTGDFQLSWLVE
jgi:hypothetical protein